MPGEHVNQSLKSKRDELVKSMCVFPFSSHEDDDYRSEYFTQGFDAAIQAVIELLGPEFDDQGVNWAKCFREGAKFQHEQMLNKLRGEV
jgi:hypothetical protein